MGIREEINMEETGKVTGGSYVNVSMTLREIVETDHNLARMLAEAGISATGNRGLMGATLMEAAEMRGINAYALEDKMNDYLSSK